MKHKYLLIGAIAASVVAAGSARADLIVGAPVTVPADNSMVMIEFLGADATYTGDLYFLGWGDEFTVLEWAENSDEAELGQWVANNQYSGVGDTMWLDGIYSAGSVLHLAYNVVEVTDPPDGLATYRTDDPGEGHEHFAWDAAAGHLAIEDLPFYESDFDYNDAEFNVSFQQVPAPGVLALLGLGGLIPARRRRI